jgi:hypothetical protein
LLILTVLTVKHRYIFTTKFPFSRFSMFQAAIVKGRNRNSYEYINCTTDPYSGGKNNGFSISRINLLVLVTRFDWRYRAENFFKRQILTRFFFVAYAKWANFQLCLYHGKGDSAEEVALWLLTSLCTSAKREVEVAL